MPTIIKWPGVTKAGSVFDALISQIDFMATFAAALGYALPDNAAEDSHDLLPLLKGEVESVRTTHVHNTNKPYAIRHGDWLLVDGKGSRNAAWEKRHGYPADTNSPVELYNLKTDLAQKYNVAIDNAIRRKLLLHLVPVC